VPGECAAWGEARLLPGLSPEAVKHVITERLAQLEISHFTLEDLVAVPAVEIAAEAEIVQALARAAEVITGTRP
jgi:acetylornithine deacetylase/succinyl-diaminopimelate desuccinylase-like protein